MKVLFLLKQNYDYSWYSKSKAGLYNSALLIKEALEKHMDTKLVVCVDGNSIDKELHDYKPDFAILEAIWVTPDKLRELVALHPRVRFIVRIHSKISFLAHEGNALEWIIEYSKINNVDIAYNEKSTAEDFLAVDIKSSFLPNIYKYICQEPMSFAKRAFLTRKALYNRFRQVKDIFPATHLNVGCFGAIRPMKNQLLQAFAALEFAKENGYVLHFHINSPRQEQGGNSVLKNLRALFKDRADELVEHDWLSHNQFLELIQHMDIGLQTSMSESFNIVSADFVRQGVPIVASTEVTWLPEINRVVFDDVKDTKRAMDYALKNSELNVYLAQRSLNQYSENAFRDWMYYLSR